MSCHVSSGVRLRRIFFFQQGTPEGAYSCYVTEGVTPQKGKKTSKMRQLIHDRALIFQTDISGFCLGKYLNSKVPT